ncbi:hypothetical protein [Alistipes putredinis]|uniref:hypothetical protein n=1 Tax=Alistipes putredinis TaxID=28117 RepID=UPI0040281E97
MKRYFAIILFAAALASCTPKLYDAQVEVPENYRFAGDFPQDSVSLPFAWWEIFGDSTRSIAWWSTRSRTTAIWRRRLRASSKLAPISPWPVRLSCRRSD